MKPILDTYLSRQTSSWLTKNEPVSPDLGMSVMIPCYNEPDLLVCVRSLLNAESPACDLEIMIVVNSGKGASEEILRQNEKTLHEIADFAAQVNSKKIRVLALSVVDQPTKYAGAGLARKVGMDEIVRRFAVIGNNAGVIISMDADCVVESNYFKEIEAKFYANRKLSTAIIHFEHPLSLTLGNERLRDAMIQYELYLRYYKQALQFTGFPFAYYTIGSAFAVKAETYCRAGGMGKYQGGEDFYFLQKVFPLGKTIELNTTAVYPASRLSDRVPFGTGPSLIRLVESGEVIKPAYAWESFRVLKTFFAQREVWYKRKKDTIALPEALLAFLTETGFFASMDELSANCSVPEIFCRRFFDWFTGLRVLQCLNTLQETYPSTCVTTETLHLLKEVYSRDIENPDAFMLLEIMRRYK